MLDSITANAPTVKRDDFIFANTRPLAQTFSRPTPAPLSVGGFGSSTVFRAFAAQGLVQPLRQLGGVWGSILG